MSRHRGHPGVGQPRMDIAERQAIREAKRDGRLALPYVIRFWISVFADKTLPTNLRMKAAGELASRCGLPYQQQIDVDSDAVSVAIDAGGELNAAGMDILRGRFEKLEQYLTERETPQLPEGQDNDDRS
jgi:hypothetical protein